MDIAFGNNFDTNLKIQRENLKGKQNSKIAFEFQNLIQTKMKIRDLFSVLKKTENK